MGLIADGYDSSKEIAELEKQLKQWQDKFCEVVKAKDQIVKERDEARKLTELWRQRAIDEIAYKWPAGYWDDCEVPPWRKNK